MIEDQTADVVVVGGGPVGIMAALRGAQRGLRVIAIDKASGIFPLPRAIGMDDEIQRLFHTAGLGPELQAVSTPLRGAEFVDANGKRLVGVDIPEGMHGPNGHPPMTMFDQPALERALREAAIKAGVSLRLGVEAESIDQRDAGVTVVWRDLAGDTGRIDARWLVGADGAASYVRSACKIGVLDQGFDQEWLVIDTTLTDPACSLPQGAQQVCDPERIITFVPGHEQRRRWEIQLKPGETRAQVIEDGWIHSLLGRWAAPDQLTLDRKAVYRFHAVVAETFRDESIFLAGDAAHQMPPFNGQGMNTGMRDAENLMWKLAMVQQGRAHQRLLDTYDQERRPHATGQVAHAADAGRLIDALARGEDMSTESGYGGSRPFPHLEAGMVLGDHPAVGSPLPQPDIDGTPLDQSLGDGFAIVTNNATAADAVDSEWDWLNPTVAIVDHPALAGLCSATSSVVVRPDRYVAAVSTNLHADARRLHDMIAP